MYAMPSGVWCEGCFHPVDADEAAIVLVVKRVGDFEHPVVFHRRCYDPGNRLYSRPLWVIHPADPRWR